MASEELVAPQDEKVYEWDNAEIGDRSPPFVYEVTAEKIAQYSRAVGYENPVYLSDAAAKEVGFPGVLAPATMLYTYAPVQRLEVTTSKGSIPPDHSTRNPRSTPFVSTDISFQGVPVRPGDVITSTTSVVDKFQRRGNKFITFRVIAINHRDETVAEYDFVCLWETQTRRLPHHRPSPEQSPPLQA